MDKLTSQLENYFAADEEGEGAQPASNANAEDSLIDTTDFGHEGDQVAEHSIAEASKATSLEEKEKLLSVVKQNVDQIKSDLGELLKNTWAQRIQEIQSQMSNMEKDKKKSIAAANTDNAATKAIEKEYRGKMEVL